ncbi:MAG: sulfatase-like hydrolase/transferase, partial [Coraliomargaritaceae bacterium]
LFVCLLSADSQKTPHILFIAVDDLRPELNCYGAERSISPNIDRLAAMGTLYENAYVQVPVCGASRASLMAGMYPTEKRFTWYGTRFDRPTSNQWGKSCTGAPNIPDIPEWFKENGYKTFSMGKIYHYANDNEQAWDLIDRVGYFKAYQLPENQGKNPAYESAPVEYNAYPTGIMTDKIIQQMRDAKDSDQPHFFTAGFSKPHLPFVAPKKYWDLYDAEDLTLPSNYTFFPKDAPSSANSEWGELRNMYDDIPSDGPVSDAMALKLIHGYLACVSYTDDMIGKLLDELESLEMLDDTIVILWGDHGFQLGDHTLWCKHTLFETSMHAPLIISAPGYGSGQRVNSLVEMVDIYPTLCELAGLELPTHLQGKSLVPTMEDPNTTHKKAIYGRYHAGETVRTERFQYSEWSNGDKMLYDHKKDPNEDINVVANPKYAKVVEALAAALLKHREKIAFDESTSLEALEQPENFAPAWNKSAFNQKETRQPVATVGTEYQSYVNWRVKDVEGDSLTYAKISGPEWLKMSNAKYGRLNGIPTKSDRGTNVFVLSVTDGVNPPVLAEMTLEVQ